MISQGIIFLKGLALSSYRTYSHFYAQVTMFLQILLIYVRMQDKKLTFIGDLGHQHFQSLMCLITGCAQRGMILKMLVRNIV